MRQGEKDEIRQIIREEVRGVVQEELNAALTRTITIERTTADREAYRTDETWNVLDFLAGYIPYLQGAVRGCQEDVDKAKNEATENTAKLQAIGQTLVDMEESARSLIELRDSVQRITENPGLVVREALMQEGESRVKEALSAGHNP